MLFKGRLRLPADAGEGIPIDLTLEDVFLSLDSEGEEFGEWRLDTVEISRLFSNQFSLRLDGEEMVFVAADALGFAYEGVSFVEEVQSRLKKRRFFKGRKPKRAEAPEPSPAPEPEEPTPATPASAPVADVPMPAVQPFFPEPAASEPAAAPPSSAPAADTRPSSSPPEIEPAPAGPVPERRSLHPLGDPDEEVGQAAPEPAETVPPAAVAPPEDVELDDDDELVIEDVNPYGYQAPVTHIPEKTPEPGRNEPEPQDEVVDEPVVPAEAPQPVAQDATAVEPEVAAAEETVPEEPPVPVEARAGESSVPQTPDAAEPPSTEPELEDQDLEDQDEGGEEPATRIARTGRHARSESKSRTPIFGRRKSREPEPHDHVYESSKTVGGITRRVCGVCDHVSFAGEDVYQNW